MAANSKNSLGDTSQSLVEYWLNTTGETVNPIKYDKTGKDLFLEISTAEFSGKSSPFDKRPGDLSCHIQVKGTHNQERKSIGIKLDNWERYIKDPLPCFIVILVYTEQNLSFPQSTYLVHIDKQWVEKALHRLAKIKPGEKIHKKRMVVTWSDENMISRNDGHELLNKIKSHIGVDLKKYISKKAEWVQSVGYGKFPYEFTLTTEGQTLSDAYKLMADFAIGLIDELPARFVSCYETRFGMKRHFNDPELVGKDVYLKTKPTSMGNALITVYNCDGKLSGSFSGESFFASAMFPFLPKEYHCLRIVSDYVSLLITQDTITYSCSWNQDMLVNLGEFGRTFAALCSLSTPGEKPRIDVEIDNVQHSFFPKPYTNTPKYLSRIFQVSSAALRIIQYFNLPNNLHISLGELEKKAEDIFGFAQLLRLKIGEGKVTFKSNQSVTGCNQAAFVAIEAVRLGRFTAAVAIVIKGKLASKSMNGDQQAEIVGQIEVSNKKLFSRKWPTKTDFQQMIDNVRNKLTESGIDFVGFVDPEDCYSLFKTRTVAPAGK